MNRANRWHTRIEKTTDSFTSIHGLTLPVHGAIAVALIIRALATLPVETGGLLFSYPSQKFPPQPIQQTSNAAGITPRKTPPPSSRSRFSRSYNPIVASRGWRYRPPDNPLSWKMLRCWQQGSLGMEIPVPDHRFRHDDGPDWPFLPCKTGFRQQERDPGTVHV
ncbi:hypothetical protein HOY80DRAFT_1059620 [Tuber brumale]|nr:hypothetical protein HOY80DRAFT_1059620 [Tuber brumale]